MIKSFLFPSTTIFKNSTCSWSSLNTLSKVKSLLSFFEIVLHESFDKLDFVLDLRKTSKFIHLIDFVVEKIFILGQREVVLSKPNLGTPSIIARYSSCFTHFISNEFFERHLSWSSNFKLLQMMGSISLQLHFYDFQIVSKYDS